MINPYFYETADALDTTWTTPDGAEAVRCLIDAALAVEDDPYWIAELHEKRAAALAALQQPRSAEGDEAAPLGGIATS